jgi:H-NS histone family
MPAHKGQRKGPQPEKYIDPKTGATWSGRGPAPAWLAGSERPFELFLIAGVDASSANAGSAKIAGKKPIAKKVAAKKSVATKPASKKAPAKNVVTAKTAGGEVAVKATQNPARKEDADE